MNKKIMVSDGEYEKRLAICKDCEHFHRVLWKCGVCGCFLKIKATLKGAQCPKQKW